MPVLRTIFLLLFISCSPAIFGQLSIQLFGGYQNTRTTVGEYAHPTLPYYRIDSVSLSSNLHSPVFGVAAEFEVASHFYLNTGFTFSNKGIKYVTYTSFENQYYVSWVGKQEYFGVHVLVGYHRNIGTSPFGWFVGTGYRIDFPYGEPTNAALANGPGAEYIAPFGRFSNIELTWMSHLGGTYELGPGDVRFEIYYLAGLTSPIKDDYIYARTRTFGCTLGYAFRLGPD